MSAARINGDSTREGTETARGVPQRAGTQRYWVIAKDAKDGFGRPDPLTVDLDGTGQTLPVFSFEEEAEMFLWLQTTEDGREVKETTPEQLVSILYGPCADVGRVMLDPLPEIGARMQNSLLGMDRNDFVESVIGVGDGSEEPRKAPGIRIRAVPTSVLTSSMYGGRTEPNLCRHRFMNIDPMVLRRAQNGYAARCLLCNRVGPVRDCGESARLALCEQRACDEK